MNYISNLNGNFKYKGYKILFLDNYAIQINTILNVLV